MAVSCEAKRSKCEMWWRGVMAQGMKGMNTCMVWAATWKDVSMVRASLYTIQYQRFCGMSFELFPVLCVQTITSKPRHTEALQLQELQQPSCVVSKECETPGVTFCPTNLPWTGCISSQWYQLPYSELTVGCISCVNNIPSDATQAIIKCHNVNILAHVVKHNPQQRVSMGSIVWKGRVPYESFRCC